MVAGAEKLVSIWRRKFVYWMTLGICLSSILASCGLGFNPNQNNIELTLVSFAVTRAAYENIIPQFTQTWQKEHHQNVIINQSYGGSGSQTRAVLDGLDADIVALALALDVKKIQQAGLIEPGWEEELPNNSIVHKSVAAIVTREGNPKNIKNWTDLVKPEIQVITANPKTSGGAKWNFLALWGSITKNGGNEEQALEFITKIFQNAPVLPRDAREASDVFFNQEQGDALINYENEIILAANHGEKLPYIVPEINISIDNPVAVVDKNVNKHKNRQVAEAFLQYLFTPTAQKEFAKVGFRSIDTAISNEVGQDFPQVDKLLTIQDFGGWNQVQDKFFADGGIFDKVENAVANKS
ncbi:sulfate ABC transporter substrate-binding protein [Merismopedia glauca CCAP 1448/3]|uniref:Sulfate ABC transporter substrate-binding protein n=2 Tax=Merismopedia TaxID=53402 RepID=A0A2T1C6C8_9CYAN|nr:sulfate ABC transporter substrate-binding protein [Merismopedia glauca CCAP 1448/3]